MSGVVFFFYDYFVYYYREKHPVSLFHHKKDCNRGSIWVIGVTLS